MSAPTPSLPLALFGNLDLTEVLVIALFAVMIFGRNLPRVAAQAVAHVSRARKALQGVWRESGIGEEIRQVQREMEQSADVLRRADPRQAAGGLVRELEAEVARPAAAPQDGATEDSEAETAGHDSGADSEEPAGERGRVPSWYPKTLQPHGHGEPGEEPGLPTGPGISPGGLGAPVEEEDGADSGPVEARTTRPKPPGEDGGAEYEA